MTSLASWLLVAVFVGGPTLLLWSLMRIAGRASREEERLVEAEVRLGIALARAEQLRREGAFWALPENQRIELDLDDCADAADVRARLGRLVGSSFPDKPTHTAE